MTGAPLVAVDVAEVIYRRQRYVRIRIEPYTKRDGTETSMAIWGSTCPQCRQPFECSTPAVTPKFRPARRCAECRRKCKWGDRFRAEAPDGVPLLPGQRPFAPHESYGRRR